MSIVKDPAKATQKMLVRATYLGVYGLERRYPADHNHKRAGQPFEILARQFSDEWMEPVEISLEQAIAMRDEARKNYVKPLRVRTKFGALKAARGMHKALNNPNKPNAFEKAEERASDRGIEDETAPDADESSEAEAKPEKAKGRKKK